MESSHCPGFWGKKSISKLSSALADSFSPVLTVLRPAPASYREVHACAPSSQNPVPASFRITQFILGHFCCHRGCHGSSLGALCYHLGEHRIVWNSTRLSSDPLTSLSQLSLLYSPESCWRQVSLVFGPQPRKREAQGSTALGAPFNPVTISVAQSYPLP